MTDEKITDRTELDRLLHLLSLLPGADAPGAEDFWESLTKANGYNDGYVRGRICGAVLDVLDRPERLYDATYLADYVQMFFGQRSDPAKEILLAEVVCRGKHTGNGHLGGAYEWLREVRAAAWGVRRDNAPRRDVKGLREWAGNGRYRWS